VKAIVNDRYGPPSSLRLADVDRPEIGDDGVLVRVKASSVNPADFHSLRGSPRPARLMMGGVRALRRPIRPIPGIDAAGIVEAVGRDVTEFAPGDEVFGAHGGAFADYLAGRERNFVAKPARLTFEEAATLPVAGLTALQALRDKAAVEPGQHVLINGAAGGVGTFAVQIAKALGAEVTGVCSTHNVELVRSLGADHVIDYTAEDFTRNGRTYDVILDNVSNRSLSALRRILAPEGKLLPNGGGVGMRRILMRTAGAIVLDRVTHQNFILFISRLHKDDLVALAKLVDDGKITPVIDRTYPLSETADALTYLEAEHARGKVVITVA
jgi:NADPH:quinone reductase-like Zn-dependent oxidoreductase